MDEIAPENLRGAYFGSLSFQYLGKTVGAILGGTLLQILDGTITLFILALIAVGTIGFYHKSSKYIPPKEENILLIVKKYENYTFLSRFIKNNKGNFQKT